jgi:hypothetical protein
MDMAADAESRVYSETTWSSLPVASIPLREKARAVTFPLGTRTVWLLKYSTGGGSWSSGAVFDAALRSGFQVRTVESLPLEISCTVLSINLHSSWFGSRKAHNAVSRNSNCENSARMADETCPKVSQVERAAISTVGKVHGKSR